jgi:hypothetical protein
MNFYPNSSLAGFFDILTIRHSTISAFRGDTFIYIQDIQFKIGGEDPSKQFLLEVKDYSLLVNELSGNLAKGACCLPR